MSQSCDEYWQPMPPVEIREPVSPAVEHPPKATREDQPVDWHDLVGRIQANEATGLEELYRIFSRGVRFAFCRQMGPQDLQDKVHDTFLIVVQALRRGELRDPERLMGYVRTVIRRQVAGYINQVVHTRNRLADPDPENGFPNRERNPEQVAIALEQQEMAKKVLRGISRRDREVLTRFYLLEETQDEICASMNLSTTQFRLLKSRAKARFIILGRRKLAGKRKIYFQ